MKTRFLGSTTSMISGIMLVSASVFASVFASGCAEIESARHARTLLDRPVGSLGDEYAVMASKVSGAPTQMRLLPDNTASWTKRWRLMDAAKVSLDTTYFIVDPDAFGYAFLGKLYDKALEGVKVRVLVDGRGTMNLDPVLLSEMARLPNVEVKIYNPLSGKLLQALAKVDARPAAASNHDKIIVADGTESMIGGRNIASHYMSSPQDDAHSYIDLDMWMGGVKTSDKVMLAFTEEFDTPSSVAVKKDTVRDPQSANRLLLAAFMMEAWMQDTQHGIKSADDVAVAALGKYVEKHEAIVADLSDESLAWLRPLAEEVIKHRQLQGAWPAQAEQEQQQEALSGEVAVLDTHAAVNVPLNDINDALIRFTQAAQKSIVVENPYVVLTDTAVEVLRKAAERGVQITILTNSPTSSDSPLTQAYFLRSWPEILAQVPTLKLYVVGSHHLLHAKVGVFDGQVTMLGSYNLDLISAQVNGEIISAVWSPAFAASMEQDIWQRIKAGAPAIYEYTIERDAQGRAIRYPSGHVKEGKPKVAFGAEQHCSEEDLGKVLQLQNQLKLLDMFPSVSPLW